MTYLYNKNVNVLNANAIVQVSNPFPVRVIGGNTNSQMIEFPAEAMSAFGELSVTENSPDIQMDAVYGYNPDTMVILNINGGSAEANAQTSLFMANSGTSTAGSGTIRSRRYMRYRPGQGAIARFTAMYTVANTETKYGIDGVTQRAGLQIIGNGYSFGFSGSTANNKARTFGIAHTYNGEAETRTLTLNTAPTGTQTVTITLNGTPYTAVVHSGSIANAAAEITSDITANTTEWYIDQSGNTVIFTGTLANPRTGTYNISATGTGTLVNGTFVRTNPGASATTDWVYQQDWNGEAVPTLNPHKLNVYQIDYRWLGAGVVRFLMEDPENSGDFRLLHTQHWVNDNTFPHVRNPSFRIGWASNVTGTPVQPALVYGASAMGAIQGKMIQTTYSKSWYNNVGTNLNTGSLHHLLSIRNPYMRAGKINAQELQMQDLTVSAQGNDPSVVHVFINGNTSAKLIFSSLSNAFALQSQQVGPSMNTATDMPVCSFTVGINGTSQFDLIPYRLTLAPGDVLSVAIESTSSLTRAAVGLNWIPD